MSDCQAMEIRPSCPLPDLNWRERGRAKRQSPSHTEGSRSVEQKLRLPGPSIGQPRVESTIDALFYPLPPAPRSEQFVCQSVPANRCNFATLQPQRPRNTDVPLLSEYCVLKLSFRQFPYRHIKHFKHNNIRS